MGNSKHISHFLNKLIIKYTVTGNMDRKTIRLNNLRRLIDDADSAADLARRAGTSATYLSQILTGTASSSGTPRGIGDKLAANLEKAAGKDPGWMDRPHNHDSIGEQELCSEDMLEAIIELIEERHPEASPKKKARLVIALSKVVVGQGKAPTAELVDALIHLLP